MMSSHEKVIVLSLVATVGAVYLGSAWILLVGAVRVLARSPARRRPRWRRVARGAVLSLAALGVLCAGWAYFVEPYWPEVTHYTVATPKMAPGAHPIRIVQISDTHCDPKVRLEDRLPGIIADLKPDLIVFTGDAANSPEGIPVFHRLMRRLASIAPTFAVRGNWDLFPAVDLYEGTGATELRGQVMPIKLRGTTLYLVGVAWPDWTTAKALQDMVPPGALSVMLYHDPAIVGQLPIKTDLLLAGHTHGGQVALPFYGALVTLSRHGKRFERGMYDLGGTMLHVNRGIGMEGHHVPRVRFFARPDVSVIDLVAR